MKLPLRCSLFLLPLLISGWNYAQFTVGDTIKNHVQFEQEQYVCTKIKRGRLLFERFYPKNSTNDYARLKFETLYDSVGRVSQFRSRSFEPWFGEGKHPNAPKAFEYDSLGRISKVIGYRSGLFSSFYSNTKVEEERYFYSGSSTRPFGYKLEILKGYRKGLKISSKTLRMPIYYKVAECFRADK